MSVSYFGKGKAAVDGVFEIKAAGKWGRERTQTSRLICVKT